MVHKNSHGDAHRVWVTERIVNPDTAELHRPLPTTVFQTDCMGEHSINSLPFLASCRPVRRWV